MWRKKNPALIMLGEGERETWEGATYSLDPLRRPGHGYRSLVKLRLCIMNSCYWNFT